MFNFGRQNRPRSRFCRQCVRIVDGVASSWILIKHRLALRIFWTDYVRDGIYCVIYVSATHMVSFFVNDGFGVRLFGQLDRFENIKVYWTVSPFYVLVSKQTLQWREWRMQKVYFCDNHTSCNIHMSCFKNKSVKCDTCVMCFYCTILCIAPTVPSPGVRPSVCPEPVL